MHDPQKTWEDPWKPPERQLPRWYKIANTLGYGLLFAGFVMLGFFANRFGGWLVAAGVVLLASLFLGTVSFTIGQVFFSWGQIRLIELLLVIAMLGNTVGLTLQLTRGNPDFNSTWFQLLAVAVCSFWVLGSAAWSLWVIRCLTLDAAFARLRVLALGWLALPAIYGVTIGWVHLLVMDTRGALANTGKIAGIPIIFILGLMVLWRWVALHHQARKAYWLQHDGGAPQENAAAEPPAAPPPTPPA